MMHLAQFAPHFPIPFVQHNRRRALEQTIRRVYATWQGRFPRWVNTGFDDYFLLHDALPLLRELLDGECPPDPTRLAQCWVIAFAIPHERFGHAVAEVTPVAADFLMRLQSEIER